MPCDGGPSYRDHAEEERRKLTAMLCWTCHALLVKDVRLPPEIDLWYYRHVLEDEKRGVDQERQRMREHALSKLTDEEQQALGV